MERSTDHDFYQRVPRPVGAMAKLYPSGYSGFRHSHPRAQFLYAQTGTMKVITDRGTWVVPPHRAVWFPANTPHQTGALSALEVRTLYIRPDACPPRSPLQPLILYVSPLLRELVIRATEMPVEYDEQGKDGRTIALLLEEIDWSPAKAIRTPTLQNPRLLRIEKELTVHPCDPRTLEEWSLLVETSPRTLSRLFLKETGMSFRCWREQLRAVASLPRLLQGELVMNLALEFGYETPGAFAAMFRRVMGTTPSHYFEANMRRAL